MIKLDRICNKLEEIRDILDEKINAILDNADERERDLTDREQERVDEMEAELNDIDSALDFLRDYCTDC